MGQYDDVALLITTAHCMLNLVPICRDVTFCRMIRDNSIHTVSDKLSTQMNRYKFVLCESIQQIHFWYSDYFFHNYLLKIKLLQESESCGPSI